MSDVYIYICGCGNQLDIKIVNTQYIHSLLEERGGGHIDVLVSCLKEKWIFIE